MKIFKQIAVFLLSLVLFSGLVYAKQFFGTQDFTGATTTVAAPSADSHASTKKYVDDSVGSATSFTGLTDTPANFTGSSGLVVKVNAGETALEFGSAGGGDVTDVFDCSTGDCNQMTVGTSEYLTYGTGYIDANRFAGVTTVDATEFGYLNGLTAAIAYAGGAFHDGFSDFVANEHLDWTTDRGATNIHAGNYTDTNTTYTAGTGLTLGTGAFSVNTSQNISTLSSLTGNGFVKTTGGTGALSIDTSTYLTTETDPNALLTAGTDNVKDTHIDWGTGASQVSSADMPDHDGHTVRDTFVHVINRGKSEVITVTLTGGLGVSWIAGEIYDRANHTFVATDAGSGNVTNTAVNYLKWVSGTALTLGTADVTGDEVLVATFSVYDGAISGFRESSLIDETAANLRRGTRALFPNRVESGMSVYEDVDATNPLDVVMDAGVMWKEMAERKAPVEIKTRTTAMVRNFHTAGVWDSDTNAQIETTNYDNGTALTAIPSNKYVKGLFIFMNGKIGFVYPTEYFTTIAQAQEAALPAMPTGLEPIPKLTAIVYQQGDTDFTTAIWQDVRAGISEQSFSGVTDHGALAGLADDDHPQYGQLADAETITGNWVNTAYPWADNEVSNTLTVDGYMQDTDIDTFAELQSWAVGYTDNNTTYVSSDFTHDDLTGFVANEHLDWTTDRGATNIHSGNYTDTNTTYTAGGTLLDLTGTVFSLNEGTLTDTKYCTYSTASGIVCNSEGGSGYTNLTSFVDQTAWRVFYSNTAGDVTELALGADGTYLRSNGAAAAPTFSTPSGSGDVSKVGTPANDQVGIWTGNGTIEGDVDLTFDGTTLSVDGLTVDDGTAGTAVIEVGEVGNDACIKLRDSDNGGWSYLTVLDGVLSASTVSCE